jgi:hypothetical protein
VQGKVLEECVLENSGILYEFTEKALLKVAVQIKTDKLL